MVWCRLFIINISSSSQRCSSACHTYKTRHHKVDPILIYAKSRLPGTTSIQFQHHPSEATLRGDSTQKSATLMDPQNNWLWAHRHIQRHRVGVFGSYENNKNVVQLQTMAPSSIEVNNQRVLAKKCDACFQDKNEDIIWSINLIHQIRAFFLSSFKIHINKKTSSMSFFFLIKFISQRRVAAEFAVCSSRRGAYQGGERRVSVEIDNLYNSPQ